MSKDRRLGRGLAALLGTPLEDEVIATAPIPREDYGRGETRSPGLSLFQPGQHDGDEGDDSPADHHAEVANGGLFNLSLDQIDENPFQPRRDFSEAEIASLAESLKTHDILQPILVRRVDGRYQLISGERRLRAAKQAGWTSIPARVREADDRLVAELAIVENLQRQDLNAIEKALSFKRYLDQHRCTQDDLAKRLKIDRSTIANLMRLLELPQTVLDSIRVGSVSAGHARALLPLGDDRLQTSFCHRIQADGLSVRDVERLVSEHLQAEDGTPGSAGGSGVLAGQNPAKKARTKSEQIASLEQELRHSLGTKVEIKPATRGRGKIVIHFGSHEEFERLQNELCGTPLPGTTSSSKKRAS